MVTSIQKWGNSQGIRLPKYLLEALKWNDNECLEINAEDDHITIKKAEHRKTIQELFAGFNGEYFPEKVDWGTPVGKEIW